MTRRTGGVGHKMAICAFDPSQPCLLYHLIGPSKRPDRGKSTRPDRARDT